MLRCRWFGCERAIYGHDDSTIGELMAVYPDWGFDGGIMLCRVHKRQSVEDAAWNAALEAAAVTAEGNARELRDGHPPFTTTHEVMDEAEAKALERFAVEIRALKRTT